MLKSVTTQAASIVLRGRIPSLIDWWVNGSPLWELLWQGDWEPTWRPSPLGLDVMAAPLPVDPLPVPAMIPNGYTALYWDPKDLGDPLPTIACRLVALSGDAVLLADISWQSDHPEMPEDHSLLGDLVVSRSDIEAVFGRLASVEDVVDETVGGHQDPVLKSRQALRRLGWRRYGDGGWTLTDPLGGRLWADRLARPAWLVRAEDRSGSRWASTLGDAWLPAVAKRMAATGASLPRRRENLTQLEVGKTDDTIRIVSQFTGTELDRLWSLHRGDRDQSWA